MLVFVCTFLLNVKWFVEFSVRNVYILLNVNEIQMSVYGFSFFVLELVFLIWRYLGNLHYYMGL